MGGMKIEFILNGEDVTFEGGARMRLVDILRDDFALLGAKACCLSGKCGLCSVIFNGSVCNACLIPAFRLRGGEVITVEGFYDTDEYLDIKAGFEEAGVEDCGYCRTSKLLVAGSLLGRGTRPSTEEIVRTIDGVKCRCTDYVRLVDGIEKAFEARLRRLDGRSG